jgi:hypothetical protein
MPFDKLTVLSKIERLTALSKAEGQRCPSFLRYCGVMVSTSHPEKFARLAPGTSFPAIWFMTFYENINLSFAKN